MNPDANITEYVENALNGSAQDSSFSLSDLIADIDAVGINELMINAPIYEAFTNYYSDDYKNRYSMFVEYVFNGDADSIISTANDYLNPKNNLTSLFMKIFNSEYNDSIMQDVSKGFSNFIIGKI